MLDIITCTEYYIRFIKPVDIFDIIYPLKIRFRLDFECIFKEKKVSEIIIFSSEKDDEHKQITSNFLKETGMLNYEHVVKYIDDEEQIRKWYKNKNTIETPTCDFETYWNNLREKLKKYRQFFNFVDENLVSIKEKQLLENCMTDFFDNIETCGYRMRTFTI